MIKKILSFFMLFMIVSCSDTPLEIEQYTESGTKEMKQVMELVQMQSKYPDQFEFSLRSVLELKEVNLMKSGREASPLTNGNEVESRNIKRFYSSLGLINDKYVLESEDIVDYIVISFNHSEYTKSHPEATYNVCFNVIEDLKKENMLYGFNIDNTKINKRIVEINDEKWTDLLCKSYMNEQDSVLRIALNPI